MDFNKCRCRDHKTHEEVTRESLYLETVKVETVGTIQSLDKEHATLLINNSKIKFKLDIGAEANVTPYQVFQGINNVQDSQLQQPKSRLTAYNGHEIPTKGAITLECKHNERLYKLEFYVTTLHSEPVLSIGACKELGLIKFITTLTESEDLEIFTRKIKAEFKDIFTGLGCLEKPYKIELDSTVTPVVRPPRKLPYGIRDKVKQTLDDMTEQGVIVPVDKPTDWVNSMVVVEKKNSDKLRICIDPRDLNKAIKREHYQLPTIEEIVTRLNGDQYFSTLDARSGYWQIPLDQDSSKLTTFATPFGRYALTKMPFGIRSAQEVFHKTS